MANNNAAEIEEFDELEAMLSDMQDDVAPEEVEQVDATADIDLDELSDDLDEAEQVESTIQLKVPKKASTDKEEIEEADFEEVEPVSTEKVEKKKPKKTSAPKFVASGSLIDYGQKLFDNDKPLLLVLDDADEAPETATKANLEAIDAVKPVKVREKIANALAWVSQGKTLSKYTKATFELVKSKGEVTKADVTNHLLDQGVNLGTASSQSGQMSHILTSLKVATFDGSKFKANPDSLLLQMLSVSEESEPEEISKAA